MWCLTYGWKNHTQKKNTQISKPKNMWPNIIKIDSWKMFLLEFDIFLPHLLMHSAYKHTYYVWNRIWTVWCSTGRGEQSPDGGGLCCVNLKQVNLKQEMTPKLCGTRIACEHEIDLMRTSKITGGEVCCGSSWQGPRDPTSSKHPAPLSPPL